MSAITRYDGQMILSLSQKSGLSVDQVSAVVSELAPDENAIRNRIQVLMFERDAKEAGWSRMRRDASEHHANG